jgi:hypothetical protein
MITASDTKGQKAAEKGLKGNLNTNTLLALFGPFRPLSKKATPFKIGFWEHQ